MFTEHIFKILFVYSTSSQPASLLNYIQDRSSNSFLISNLLKKCKNFLEKKYAPKKFGQVIKVETCILEGLQPFKTWHFLGKHFEF